MPGEPRKPPSGFDFVKALQQADVAVWWLDAERAAAESSFHNRAEGNPDDFYRLAVTSRAT